MANQNTTQRSLKKDKHVNPRGGNSRFLDLFCSKCNQHFALYQKDGHGRLFRIYLDRIFAPQELTLLQSKVNRKTEMPNLKCPKCGTLIGTPMVYEAERRLAFRLIHSSFVKKERWRLSADTADQKHSNYKKRYRQIKPLAVADCRNNKCTHLTRLFDFLS